MIKFTRSIKVYLRSQIAAFQFSIINTFEHILDQEIFPHGDNVTPAVAVLQLEVLRSIAALATPCFLYIWVI